MADDDSLPLFAVAKRAPDVQERQSPEIVSEFLLQTLVERPVVRSRGGVSFMTAYTWRGAIKDVQLRALRILKRHLPTEFIVEASGRLASLIVQLHGKNAFRSVTPVPCGHSMRNDCLSHQLAAGVAAHLGIEFAAVLAAPLSRGSSHPCESRNWRAPKVARPLAGRVILVDDVATTGRHMCLSLAALRAAGADAAGIAWIGSR